MGLNDFVSNIIGVEFPKFNQKEKLLFCVDSGKYFISKWLILASNTKAEIKEFLHICIKRGESNNALVKIVIQF